MSVTYSSIKKRFRSTTNIKVGDYVIACNYSDNDINDPWSIDIVESFGEDHKGFFITLSGQPKRRFRKAMKLTYEEGKNILAEVR